MKKYFLLFIILFNQVLGAQTAEKVFDKANEFYKKGNFYMAIENYKSIEKSKLVSSDLYFNLGNCYYKLNKVAPAIYYYEKALKLEPTHEDAKINLTFANRMTIDAIEQMPQSVFQKFSDAVINKLSFNTWAIISVVASFLTMLLFVFYYFSVETKPKFIYFNGALLSLVILLASVSFAYIGQSISKSTKAAIIFNPVVEIKNAPTNTSELVFELHEGTKVFVLDSLDNWKKIKIADGKIGWINKKAIKEI